MCGRRFKELRIIARRVLSAPRVERPDLMLSGYPCRLKELPVGDGRIFVVFSIVPFRFFFLRDFCSGLQQSQ